MLTQSIIICPPKVSLLFCHLYLLYVPWTDEALNYLSFLLFFSELSAHSYVNFLSFVFEVLSVRVVPSQHILEWSQFKMMTTVVS